MKLSAGSVEFMRRLVRRRSGVSLEADKGYLIESRLLALREEAGASSLEDLVSRLRSDGAADLQRKAVEAVVNTETSFFRDFHVFEAFRTAALPDLLRRRGGDRRLALWSAACATGQEPYSLAMILHQAQPPLAGWSVRLLASDFSFSVLDYARAGRYTQAEVNRGLPAGFLVTCFEQEGSAWTVREEVRRRIEFRQINLTGPWPPGEAMDAIFLRNVLIYFDKEARREVLRRIRMALRPGGCLFLGGTETLINMDDGFEPVPLGRAVAYRSRPQAAGPGPSARGGCIP